jgi:hypothetical protein
VFSARIENAALLDFFAVRICSFVEIRHRFFPSAQMVLSIEPIPSHSTL